MKNRRYQAATKAAAGAAFAVIILLLVLAGPLEDKISSQNMNLEQMLSADPGKSCLTVDMSERRFNGKGMFDPMEGVTALDVDGSDIAYKVAVAYVTGDSLFQKEIRYTLYNENRQKFTAVSNLQLEGYEGPQIEMGEMYEVSYSKLETLKQDMIKESKLKGTDGFGKDISSAIVYEWELDTKTQTAELTFTLTNEFNDRCIKGLRVKVSEIPMRY